jgi:peptide/nickel transport system substrate-binding protein
LNYAIDREAIVRHVFGGEAVPASSDMITPEFIKVSAYPYNPEKAKQLLKEAGYPNGFQITLKTCTMTPGAELPVLGQVAAMYWSSIGLDVKVIPSDYGTIRSEWVDGKANDFFWTHRGIAWTSILTGLDVNYTSKFDWSSFSTIESEAMVENILKEFDPKKRSKMVRELAKYLHDQAFALPIVYANEPYAVSDKISSWPTIRQYATCLDQIR